MNIGRERLGQEFLILGVRDLNRTKLAGMVVQNLRIAQQEAASAQPFYELHHCDLTSIAFARKHAFACEYPADHNPIAATHQLPLVPRLEAVRVAARLCSWLYAAIISAESQVFSRRGPVVAQAVMTSRKARSKLISKRWLRMSWRTVRDT